MKNMINIEKFQVSILIFYEYVWNILKWLQKIFYQAAVFVQQIKSRIMTSFAFTNYKVICIRNVTYAQSQLCFCISLFFCFWRLHSLCHYSFVLSLARSFCYIFHIRMQDAHDIPHIFLQVELLIILQTVISSKQIAHCSYYSRYIVIKDNKMRTI